MTFVKFVLFSVGLMLAVTWLTNVLPQMQSNPPEDEVPIVAGEIDMLGMIVLGESCSVARVPVPFVIIAWVEPRTFWP